MWLRIWAGRSKLISNCVWNSHLLLKGSKKWDKDKKKHFYHAQGRANILTMKVTLFCLLLYFLFSLCMATVAKSALSVAFSLHVNFTSQVKVQGAIWPCNSWGYSHAELQVNASLTSTEEVLNLLCDCNSLLVGGGWLRIWWFYRFQYQESRKDLSFLIYIVNHGGGSFPKGILTRSALAVLPTSMGTSPTCFLGMGSRWWDCIRETLPGHLKKKQRK